MRKQTGLLIIIITVIVSLARHVAPYDHDHAAQHCPTAIFYCMDVLERINGLSHVSRALPRGHFQDGDGGGAPAVASTARLSACLFSKPDRVSK